jgi:broad specificity phosphatase PhoE
MTTLVFVRHGETDMAGKFCGHSDPELNIAGERQLAGLVKAIAPLGIQRILSSDLRRASRTATAIGQHIGVSTELRPHLREIHFGLWEGLSWQEIERQFPQEASRWIQEFPSQGAPAGEGYAAFTARVEAVISPLVQERRGVTTAVVTHRGVMRYALAKFAGLPAAETWTKTAPYGAVVVATIGLPPDEVSP